uniref:Transmembrane protein 244 n=1 Tax=Erpetoichthys calabaricus TaxID=27687 RepID=A0A8C4RMX4_ERPCA
KLASALVYHQRRHRALNLCLSLFLYVCVCVCVRVLETEDALNLISLEVSYAVSGLLFVWIVEEWVWDYAITITLFHIGLTTAVMSDFPAAVHWWIALGSGLSVMIIGGQLLAYKLYKNNFIYPVLEDF